MWTAPSVPTPSLPRPPGVRGLKKLTSPSCVHTRNFPKFPKFNSGQMKLQVICSDRRVPITHATRKQSTSLICRAAPGGAGETPVTIKSPTEAPIIGLVNPPQLDYGGTGLPPYDEGGCGGGGGGGGSSSGGGGGSSSGEFFPLWLDPYPNKRLYPYLNQGAEEESRE